MLLSYLLSLFLILVGSVVMLYVLFSILAICFPSPVSIIVEILYFHLIFSISFSSEFVLGLFSAFLRWKIVLYFTIYLYLYIYLNFLSIAKLSHTFEYISLLFSWKYFRFPFWFLWSERLGIIYLSVLFTNEWKTFLYILLLTTSGFFVSVWFISSLIAYKTCSMAQNVLFCWRIHMDWTVTLFAVRLIFIYEFWGAVIRCIHIYDVILSLVHWYRYKLPSLGAGALNTGPFACKPNALTHWAMSPAALLG